MPTHKPMIERELGETTPQSVVIERRLGEWIRDNVPGAAFAHRDALEDCIEATTRLAGVLLAMYRLNHPDRDFSATSKRALELLAETTGRSYDAQLKHHMDEAARAGAKN